MPSPKSNPTPSSDDICALATTTTEIDNETKKTKPKFSKTSVEGCQTCGRDDDHSNLLLCEACNDEYHIYCLDPPLSSVPEGDFFCHKCQPLLQIFVNNNDELDKKVSSLSPLFTQRFGEIIWAAGGQGFGWWPACIYDPRLTVGGARKLALKHLGKRHLVYFFGCADTPFACLPDNKCMPWDDGLMEEFDTGRTAKNAGKKRSTMFEWALQAAIAENQKPIECRLDWNHEEDPFITGDGGAGGAGGDSSSGINDGIRQVHNNNNKRLSDEKENERKEQKKQRSNSSVDLVPTRRSNRSIKPSSIMASIQDQKDTEKKLKSEKSASLSNQHQEEDYTNSPTGAKTNRQAINRAMISMNGANQIEETSDSDFDDTFFCKVLRKINHMKYRSNDDDDDDNNNNNITSTHDTINDVNIGFITLSKKISTFADARKKILSEFDDDMLTFATAGINKKKSSNWKFYIPHLGPMSKKQESKFGSMYDMLIRNGDGRVGNGTSRYPLKVIIYDS